ncbi:transcription termination factor Rho [Kocuria coralli]|uniref:Transcription termination factor Rho n=1 Tax=Kocuria coralli TaxID=1461025 RepID=A0A5J5L115_9MICC|nr:transcription termination factor Rho [Kocuria coralli]KAA9395644.1 transcription termination factor Rho [Kocuria coralli]
MTETTDLTTGADQATSDAKSTGLSGLKLAQLQALAAQLGITGARRMRKSLLVDAIEAHQRGGSVADRDRKVTDQIEQTAQRASAKAGATPNESSSDSAGSSNGTSPAASAESAGDAPAVSARTGRGRSRRASSAQGGEQAADSSAAQPQGSGNDKPAKDSEGGPAGESRTEDSTSDDSQSGQDSNRERPSRSQRRNRNRDGQGGEQGGQDNADSKSQQGQGGGEDRNDDDSARGGKRNRQGRNQDGQKQDGQKNERNNRGNNDRNDRGNNDRNEKNADKSSDRGGDDSGKGDQGGKNKQGNKNKQSNQQGGQDDDGSSRRNRRNRNRNDRNDRRNRRNRNSGPEVDDTEPTEDDVLLPVAGILDVLDNYAFVRTSGYLPGSNDVYVSLAQVKKNNLRKGDAVVGAIRAPRDGEENNNRNQRQKFNALVQLTSVNGKKPEELADRVDFSKLVPLYPQERLRLESEAKKIGPRVVDLVAPIGKGQRGLIVSPPKAGKTLMLQSIANAITTNNPEVHLMMVLVDERPEEVTDMQRTVKGEVIASTFDRPADDHTTVAELAIERAKRLVELGMDVVVLLDSMTRLGRAYNLAAPASGRILSGGVDSAALYPPKRFFGAARNIEGGGSLTILATALVETGSKMDEVIFEEFKGTGNMELRLSRQLADKRIFPAVDVNSSGTRREENLMANDELKIMWKLRRVLSSLDQQQALELLTNRLRDTQSNAEFLMKVQKTTLNVKTDDDR